MSTQSLEYVGRRAAKLVTRGVRRVFALDIEHRRALEWSHATGEWQVLEQGGRIEDPALAVTIPIDALFDARSDDAIARALRTKRHPEFVAEREAGRAEGKAEARARAEAEAKGRAEGEARGLAESLLIVLAGRDLQATEAERRRILEERDHGQLERWLGAVFTCGSIAELLAMP